MNNIICIYSETWDDLKLKMIDWYHDHCYHYYSGLTENVPDEYVSIVDDDRKYVFICEEK